ncbi:cytochrome P450 [Boeremia exigua]|uniref:cytochrome P450 n=1 Tax=Boeremia exigua TaxID=749465 RepID=UPI001E8CDD3C|nr:cytochrome P450 [Boeremia exigua]KAH6612393.1 cytochrome P450 [Boeremia exigua]
MLYVQLLNFALVGVLAWTIFKRLLISPMRRLPGPWYLKLSDLPFKYHEFYGTKRLWIHNLHLRYGPVICLGPANAHFASAAAAKAIYSTGSKDYVKTEFYDLFRQEGHINLFTAIDSKKHSEIRKPLADRYSNTNILASKVLDAITERANVFMQECLKTESTDIYFLLHAYALDCVTSMLFHPFGTRSLDQEDHKRIVHFLSYREQRNEEVLAYYTPYLLQLWTWLHPEPEQNILADKLIREYVTSTYARDDLSPHTVAARLASLKDFDTPLAISECLDHLGAGLETTGDTLCFLIWELSQPRNHERMDRLHDELKAVRPGDRLDQLPYLNLIMQEALRLYAPGTMSLPRYVPKEGRVIDGYFVPGKTVVACQSHTLHRDAGVFPDGDAFIPERWADESKNLERQRLNMSFGFGARTCIGKHLAQAEMRALLCRVYSQYRTYPADGMDADLMKFEDTPLTSAPKGKLCRIRFELYEDIMAKE